MNLIRVGPPVHAEKVYSNLKNTLRDTLRHTLQIYHVIWDTRLTRRLKKSIRGLPDFCPADIDQIAAKKYACCYGASLR